MSKITLYLSGISGNSEVKKKQQRVQMILDSKCINYEPIDITEPGREKDKETMQQKAKVRVVLGKHPLPPQIFNGDDYCGDYEDFEMANEVDELEQFLHLPVPTKITSHDGTDKVNGSREEIARNGAKTEVNGDVELTSIVPETGPLSDEPEEEAEADEAVNESEEEPQTIEKDEIRDVSPLAEPAETDETLPIGEAAEPEIEVSSCGDALPEINTEIPEDKDASGVARVENDEGMVPEFVGNVGVGLVTGDEVKEFETVQIPVVSDIVLKSVQEGPHETVEEFREKSVDLVKSGSIEFIKSEAEIPNPDSENVASDERPEEIQSVSETSDRDGKVCEVGPEEKTQPSLVTSSVGLEDNRASCEAEIEIPVSGKESRPVLKHQKAVLEAEIKPVVETLQKGVDSEPSALHGEENSVQAGETVEAAAILVSLVELEENILPSLVSEEAEGDVSDRETRPVLKHQKAVSEAEIKPVVETSDSPLETLQKDVDSETSALHGEETSDRAGEAVEAAATRVSLVELEENILPSLVSEKAEVEVSDRETRSVLKHQKAVLEAEIKPVVETSVSSSETLQKDVDSDPSAVHSEQIPPCLETLDRTGDAVEAAAVLVKLGENTLPSLLSEEAEIEVSDKETRPILKHQKAVFETQLKELTEVEREIAAGSQKRELDNEAVSDSTERKQEILPVVEALKQEEQKPVEYQQERLISVESGKAEVPETEKPCVVSSIEESTIKLGEIDSEALESSSIISKKLEAITPSDTSKSGLDNQVPPSHLSHSSEAKEIGKNQSESTAITEPKVLELEAGSLSHVTVESVASKTPVKPIKSETVSLKITPSDLEAVETIAPIIEKPITVQSPNILSEDALKSLDQTPSESLNLLPKMETEQEATNPTKSASDIQEETDVLKPLARRDTLKHIKRPSLPLTKPTHDDEAPSQTHGDGVSFADLLLENHLQGEVDKISFSPQLVSKIISDQNIPKEERGLALKSWNYKPTELDFVKQVRNLLDDRDNEIICYRARQRAGGYGRMRDPHDHFVAEMGKLVKEYESDEDEIYEVVHPQPPPKIPTPPPMPPVNEFLQEVLRALNAPWHPKPKPEEPKTFVKQVKHLLSTEELTGDGQALYFTKERGPLDDDDMVHKGLGIRKRYADKQPVQDSFEAEEPEKEAADEGEQDD